MQYDIFISYSRKDSAIVEQYSEYLNAAGLSVWIDKQGIETGDEFKRNIVRAIKNSDVFLFFSSANSNASHWTVKEVNVAVDCKKKIIPVKLDMTPYEESIMFDLAGLDFFDHANNGFEIGIEKLLSVFGKNYCLVVEHIKKETERRQIEEDKKRQEESLRQQAAIEAQKRVEEEKLARIRKEEYRKALAAEKARKEAEEKAHIEREKQKLGKRSTPEKPVQIVNGLEIHEYKTTTGFGRKNHGAKNDSNFLVSFKHKLNNMFQNFQFNNKGIEPLSELYIQANEFGCGCLLLIISFMLGLLGFAFLLAGGIGLFSDTSIREIVFMISEGISCFLVIFAYFGSAKRFPSALMAISSFICAYTSYSLCQSFLTDVAHGISHNFGGMMGDTLDENCYQLTGVLYLNVFVMVLDLYIFIGTLICTNYDWEKSKFDLRN